MPEPETLDFEHLMTCREKGCLYCNDIEPRREPEVQAWLDALASIETLAA